MVKVNNAPKNIYYHDALGRLKSEYKYVTENGATHLYVQSYTYNGNGRIEEITYPDNFTIKHVYNSWGELSEIRRKDDNSLIHKVHGRNHFSQPALVSFGNGTATEYAYNGQGQLTKIKTGNMVDLSIVTPPGGMTTFSLSLSPLFAVDNAYQELAYEYGARGLMAKRSNLRNGQRETFAYDALDRLVSHRINAMPARQIAYDPAGTGNPTYKADVGDYFYESAKPHAVTKIAPNPSGNAFIPATRCAVSYNPFNQPASVTEGDNALHLYYGSDRQRERSEHFRAGVKTEVKTFVSPLYEKESFGLTTRHLNYIYGETGLVAVLVKMSTSSSETGMMCYVHTDHLGSYNLITDANKNKLDSLHFDPWGNRKRHDNWTLPETRAFFLFDRGFTGHEHLDAFRIINMNGRLYDPVIGRFFSPDPFVQMPDFAQNFNRYSYCLNNPLHYTDPDGEFIWVAVAMGAFMGAMQGLQVGLANDAKGWSMAGYILGGAAIGAASSAVGGALSSVSIGLSGMASGMVAGVGFGGLSSGGDPKAMLNGLWKGGVSGLVGSWAGAVLGGTGGAFLGGATGTAVNTALHGGNGKDILLSAAMGGAIGVGTYHLSSAINWGFGGGNNIGGLDISYRQYLAMQADFQRSRFWRKEYGGYLVGKSVVRSGKGASSQVNLGLKPNGAFAEYHTHWDRPNLIRSVDINGNFTNANKLAQNTPVGQQAVMTNYTTSQYHSPMDFNTGGLPSIVINRYDASFFSGYGTNYQVINPSISRYFNLFNWLWY
jgi:RHS repeat-associated protein